LRKIYNDAIFYNESVLFGELNISPIPSKSGCVKVAFAFISIKVTKKPNRYSSGTAGTTSKEQTGYMKEVCCISPLVEIEADFGRSAHTSSEKGM